MAQYDLSKLGSKLTYDTNTAYKVSGSLIDTNHIVTFSQDGASSDGFAQVFTVNTSTWAVTTASSALEFDTTGGIWPSCTQIDANHFVNFWYSGASNYVGVFTVNTTTWAITTASTVLAHDTAGTGLCNACAKIDTNHFIDFFSGPAFDGFCQVVTVNTTTWAVTTSSTRFEFKNTDTIQSTECVMIDANHVLALYRTASNYGAAQMCTINTTTWAVTTSSAVFSYHGTTAGQGDSCYKFDTNHVINAWGYYAVSTGYITAQVFTINTTTWAVTTAANAIAVELGNAQIGQIKCVSVDATHFLVIYYKSAGTDRAQAQLFTVNTSTWAITTTSAVLVVDTFNSSNSTTLVLVDANHCFAIWGSENSYQTAQIVQIAGAAVGPANLKTYNTNVKANIKTINTNVIANVKTLNTNA